MPKRKPHQKTTSEEESKAQSHLTIKQDLEASLMSSTDSRVVPAAGSEHPPTTGGSMNVAYVFKHISSFPFSYPLGFIIRLTAQSSAFYTGQGWRSYQNYIGARIFYPEYSTEIKSALINSTRVRGVMQSLYAKRAQEIQLKYPPLPADASVKQLKKREADLRKALQGAQVELYVVLNRMIERMIADMDSLRVVKFMGFLTNNLLVRMYHQGIHVRQQEFAELKRWADYAEKTKTSLIFLPCHKSHVDYLVISYIFYRLGVALPHIAAGDNLQMPIVGTLLKMCGAFFIRRVWGDDPLYNGVMREYVELLLNRGHNLEFFIEGTRSRIGKLLQPKFGILKIIQEAILAGRVKDAIIVPMSIGYDKVIETGTYVEELLGSEKAKESLVGLMGSVNLLAFKWGRIDVRFSKPYSLKEYLDTQITRRGSGFNPKENTGHRQLLLQNLGFQVLADINRVSVVMPTALVGTVLLTLRGRGVGRGELIRKVNWLSENVRLKNGQVADFGGMSTGWVVDRAVQVLRDLVGERRDLLEKVYYPVKRFELSFYRNQVIHLFVEEAILSIAMYATIKAGGPIPAQKILIHPTLEGDVSYLSALLKSEFIYGPSGLRENLERNIQHLSALGVLDVEIEMDTQSSTPTGRRFVTLSSEERRRGRENFDFYCFLLWPFLETYWLSAVSCFILVPPLTAPKSLKWVEEKVFMEKAQHFGKTLYYEGDLSYLEAVNKETMKNAVLRLRDMGVLLYKKSTPSQTPPSNPALLDGWTPSPSKEGLVNWVALHPDYAPAKEMPAPVVEVDVGVPSKEAESQSFALRHNNYKTVVGIPTSANPTSAARHSDVEKVAPQEETLSNSQFEAWAQYQPEGKLWDLCESIGRFRREGKNRRDTSTVAARVLRLAMVTGVLVSERRRGFLGKKKVAGEAKL
ncbi:hypothetical protein HDV05_000451 [Chytridiales sp. JEL 0842]|nr:hypothetical protein HDV05_000451 [Chytridiales sp. JEL 0842]